MLRSAEKWQADRTTAAQQQHQQHATQQLLIEQQRLQIAQQTHQLTLLQQQQHHHQPQRQLSQQQTGMFYTLPVPVQPTVRPTNIAYKNMSQGATSTTTPSSSACATAPPVHSVQPMERSAKEQLRALLGGGDHTASLPQGGGRRLRTQGYQRYI